MLPKFVRCLTLVLLVACGDERRQVSGVFDAGAADGGSGSGAGMCGNGRIDPGEACDGANLGTRSCRDFGLEGTIRCTDACTLDSSVCASAGCPTGRRECGGVCVDVRASDGNCGACGVVCGGDAFCREGACTCGGGEQFCDAECVPAGSNAHCGRCGNACTGGERCVNQGGSFACADVDVVRIEGGLLEYFHEGEWRGVCDDSFDENDAIVACRELGEDYVSHTNAQTGPSGSFWLDNLACTGSESSLSECPANPLGDENCSTGEWVRLVCGDRGAVPERNVRIRGGLLEYFNAGEWRGVCDDGFSASDGRVACRELGESYRSHTTAQRGPNAEFWLDDLGCIGDEATLAACSSSPIGTHNCSSSEWIALECGSAPGANARLQGGLLEYLHEGEWRGVCDDGFDASDGEVACRELGGTYVGHTPAQSGPSSSFWLDQLACSGSEERLAECDANPLGDEDCHAGEWVRLECSGI